MIFALVEYINRYGKISLKAFSSEEETNAFVAKLEQKNTKYLVTLI